MHNNLNRETLIRYESIKEAVWIEWKEDKEVFKDCISKLYSMVVNCYTPYKSIKGYAEIDKLVDIIYSKISLTDKIKKINYYAREERYFGVYTEIMLELLIENYLLYNFNKQIGRNNKKCA